jgi:succinoglycan biosynthesis transport protein ExoP
VLLNNASGTVAESLRSLRATLSLLGKVEDRRTILFTSAFPDEGKTFVSSNFAVSLAHQGLRTLLIDTDLRRPAVSGLFKIENSVGLVEHITQGLDLRDAVHSNVVDNLDIMTAGARCANPAELLSGTGFAETIKGALMTYDRVVIDCSPVLLVSDTLLVAPCVQTVCLVVRTAKTSRRAVKQAISSLQRANSRPVGIILNFAPEWSNHMAYSPYGYQSKEAEKYRDIYS